MLMIDEGTFFTVRCWLYQVLVRCLFKVLLFYLCNPVFTSLIEQFWLIDFDLPAALDGEN